MKPLVNFNKRSISLPPGCKDLADLLQSSSKPHGPINIEGVPWVQLPEPERIETNTLAELEPYVERVINSTSAAATLMIFAGNPEICVTLARFGNSKEAVFALSLDRSKESDRELVLRAFFERHGILPHQDFWFPSGEAKSKLGCYAYALPTEPGRAARLTTDFLREVYQLPEQVALDLSYCEDLASPAPNTA